MIISLLLNIFLSLFGVIFGMFPVVKISSIPFVGSALSGLLTQIVGVWNAFMVTFPYAQYGWTVFLVVILPFEALLLLVKFFLGHHTPANLN